MAPTEEDAKAAAAIRAWFLSDEIADDILSSKLEMELPSSVSEIERKRKRQREIKRRSRARHKNYVGMMRAQVRALEETYTKLTSTNTSTKKEEAEISDNRMHSRELLQQYRHSRNEMEKMWREIVLLRQKIERCEQFESTVEFGLYTYADPEQHEAEEEITPVPYTPLTEDDYNLIRHRSTVQIFETEAKGKRQSSSTPIIGWHEERFVDGKNVRFSVSKSFSEISAKHMMEQTWDLLTKPEHVGTLDSSTVSLKVLQVLNEDAVVVEKRMNHHYYLHVVIFLRFLMFRFPIENGYVIAYSTLHDVTTVTTKDLATKCDELFQQHEKEDDDRSAAADNEKEWVHAVKWFIFHEKPHLTAVSASDQKLDSKGEASIEDEAVECIVTYGGTLFDIDLQYANFFLVEVLTMVVRWDQAVGQPRLWLFDSNPDSQCSES